MNLRGHFLEDNCRRNFPTSGRENNFRNRLGWNLQKSNRSWVWFYQFLSVVKNCAADFNFFGQNFKPNSQVILWQAMRLHQQLVGGSTSPGPGLYFYIFNAKKALINIFNLEKFPSHMMFTSDGAQFHLRSNELKNLSIFGYCYFNFIYFYLTYIFYQ